MDISPSLFIRIMNAAILLTTEGGKADFVFDQPWRSTPYPGQARDEESPDRYEQWFIDTI